MAAGVLRTALAVVALLACAVSPAAAAGDAGYVKSTYRVPVTQPDAYGNPVALDTDVYVPTSPSPPGGYPLIDVFHGGGSSKDNGFDAAHAADFAKLGYVAILYSQRGHGTSDGQTTVAGPKDIRDI